jgi:NADH-quinone oxidoreductase subunit N
LVQAELWGLLAVAAIGSALGLFYYARFLFAAYAPADAPAPPLALPDRGLLAASAALIALLGVWPAPFLSLAGTVAP